MIGAVRVFKIKRDQIKIIIYGIWAMFTFVTIAKTHMI